MSTLSTTIQNAVRTTAPGRARTAALKAIRWVLRSGSMYVGPVKPNGTVPLVESRDEAQVYDGRDNEEMKRAFFGVHFGAPFYTELL